MRPAGPRDSLPRQAGSPGLCGAVGWRSVQTNLEKQLATPLVREGPDRPATEHVPPEWYCGLPERAGPDEPAPSDTCTYTHSPGPGNWGRTLPSECVALQTAERESPKGNRYATGGRCETPVGPLPRQPAGHLSWLPVPTAGTAVRAIVSLRQPARLQTSRNDGRGIWHFLGHRILRETGSNSVQQDIPSIHSFSGLSNRTSR